MGRQDFGVACRNPTHRVLAGRRALGLCRHRPEQATTTRFGLASWDPSLGLAGLEKNATRILVSNHVQDYWTDRVYGHTVVIECGMFVFSS